MRKPRLASVGGAPAGRHRQVVFSRRHVGTGRDLTLPQQAPQKIALVHRGKGELQVFGIAEISQFLDPQDLFLQRPVDLCGHSRQ